MAFHMPKMAVILLYSETTPRMQAFAYLNFATMMLTFVFGLVSIFSFGGFTAVKTSLTWNQYRSLAVALSVSDTLLAGIAFLIHFPLFVWVAKPLLVQVTLLLCHCHLVEKMYFPKP